MRRVAFALGAMFAIWVVYDFAPGPRHDLREFDPHEVARIETAMWRSYYDHQRVKLFTELSTLLRRQFGLPFWRSCVGAYYAARSAVVFQRGRERPDYLRALPHLVDYYGLIRRASATPFDVQRVAELELEWWIVHRQRERHAPGDLERALAELQAAIYGRPAAEFQQHARLRAEAMLVRDAGGDWGRIGELLDRSWVALHDAVQVERNSHHGPTHGATPVWAIREAARQAGNIAEAPATLASNAVATPTVGAPYTRKRQSDSSADHDRDLL